MSLPAWRRLAVSSTSAGGFPGPAAMHFLPLCSAALTTPAEPVAQMKDTTSWFIANLVVSMLDCDTEVIRFGGPPAAKMARLSAAIVCVVQRTACGWGQNTTALPAAIVLMPLLMTVEVGLVVGVMAAITP